MHTRVVALFIKDEAGPRPELSSEISPALPRSIPPREPVGRRQARGFSSWDQIPRTIG